MSKILEAIRTKKAPEAQDPVLAAFRQSVGQSVAEAMGENELLKRNLAVVTSDRDRLATEHISMVEQHTQMTIMLGDMKEQLKRAENASAQMKAAILLEQSTLQAAVKAHDAEAVLSAQSVAKLEASLQQEQIKVAELTGRLDALKTSMQPGPVVHHPAPPIPEFEIGNIVRGHDDRVITVRVKPVRTN